MERLCGIKVLHEKYGNGKIIKVDDSMHLIVKHDNVGEKKYPFPKVFIDKHLCVDDKDEERFEEILISLEKDGLIDGCKGLTKYARLLITLRKYGFEGLIHTTNFDNFISIIKSGYLMSRETIENTGKSFEDVASPGVLEKTKDEVKENVRFYYGFGTPTNYVAKYVSPVIMVFNEILMNERNVIFCNGNAGSDYTFKTEDINQALRFDWKSVFERGVYGSQYPDERHAKTRMRNAEFLYPDKVSINQIKRVYFYNSEIMAEAKAVLGDIISEIDCVVDNSKFLECGGTR